MYVDIIGSRAPGPNRTIGLMYRMWYTDPVADKRKHPETDGVKRRPGSDKGSGSKLSFTGQKRAANRFGLG